MRWTRTTIAIAVTGAAFLLGGGAAAAGALTSGSSPAVITLAPAARTASPAAPAKTTPPAPAPAKADPLASSAPALPASSPGATTNNNTPAIVVQVPPPPDSTVYVPVPAYAPAYVTGNEAVVQQYYAYLNNKEFQSAWGLGGSNVNNGVGYDAWVAGYATTSWISLGTWSYYPDSNAVGVTITATQTDGAVKTYSGSYTVSNGVIIGADIVQTS